MPQPPAKLPAKWRDAALVLAVALAVRLAYLFQSAGNPSFLHPIVDAYAYHTAAQAIVAGARQLEHLFWQPILYPMFLALIYKVFGASIWLAKIVQALIGALSCVLLYEAGRLAFSRKIGRVAGLILALYGPVVFYESELVGEVLAVLLVCALLLLGVRWEQKKAAWMLPLFSGCAALALLSRPVLLPCVASAMAIYFFDLVRRENLEAALPIVWVSALLVAACWLPVSLLNSKVSGHYTILPFSAGINLYIGNNPQWIQTVNARPGLEWDRIKGLPEKAGITDAWEGSRFFKQKAVAFAREQPAQFLGGLAQKTARYFNSRELPRNEDPYYFQTWSPLLSLLLWKVGGWGFPFGVIWPLALLGLCMQWRATPVILRLHFLLYPPMIILFFVSARYRVLWVPALALLAAVGARTVWWQWRGKCYGRAVALVLLLLGLSALTSRPLLFAEETLPYGAEFHRNVAWTLQQAGKSRAALEQLEQALRRQPAYVEALGQKATILMQLKELPAARQVVEQLQAQHPGAPLSWQLAGLLLIAEDHVDQAQKAFEHCLEIDPEFPGANFGLALCYQKTGQREVALEFCRRELEMNPAHKGAEAFLKRPENWEGLYRSPRYF